MLNLLDTLPDGDVKRLITFCLSCGWSAEATRDVCLDALKAIDAVEHLNACAKALPITADAP
jgi:hypothetical protein